MLVLSEDVYPSMSAHTPFHDIRKRDYRSCPAVA
jgi:hypothetical protein